MVYAEWQVGQVFWTMLWFSIFFLWIWVLLKVFGDIFRNPDLRGWAKGVWTLFVIFVPVILAVGKPSLMIGPADAEVSRIIDENRLGYVVANGDVNGLLKRIKQMRDDPAMLQKMGRDARRVFEERFDRDVACGRIEQILFDVVNSPA